MDTRRPTFIIALAIGSLLACDIDVSRASPPEEPPSPPTPAASPAGSGEPLPDVLLDIPARDHAPERPDEGWCAETAIQEALLYHGTLVSQERINRAGKPRHPDLYWSDVPVAMKALGLSFRRYPNNRPRNQRRAHFFDWIEAQLDAGHPVIAGVKIHPSEHPAWGLDHIVLIVGHERGRALYINTTWGYRERLTRAALSSREPGISFDNGRDRYFAYAIRGLRE